MKLTRALSFAFALATVGGCASHTARSYALYAPQRVRVHYTEIGMKSPTAPWARPDHGAIAEEARFVGEMQHRMDRLTERTQARVERGQLPRTALVELARERTYADGLLVRYSSDGKLTRDERNHIETSVAQMQGLDARPEFRTTAIGGGPRSTR